MSTAPFDADAFLYDLESHNALGLDGVMWTPQSAEWVSRSPPPRAWRDRGMDGSLDWWALQIDALRWLVAHWKTRALSVDSRGMWRGTPETGEKE